MPSITHHQRPSAASANPYEDQPQRISHYTAEQIATISGRLEKQLGPEFISTRAGAGGARVHYLAGEKAINLANEVFGFNGWSSSIQHVQVDYCDEDAQGKISLGIAVIIRVTVKDGTFHEDVGYGHIENCRGKAAAFEKSRKEAATDALKRALRNFGNVLGNCLYDKDYIAKVTKVKRTPTRWDEENLYRHSSVVPAPKTVPTPQPVAPSNPIAPLPAPVLDAIGVEFDDEFGGDVFTEEMLDEGNHEGVLMKDPGLTATGEQKQIPDTKPQPDFPEPQPRHGQTPKHNQAQFESPKHNGYPPHITNSNHYGRPTPQRVQSAQGIQTASNTSTAGLTYPTAQQPQQRPLPSNNPPPPQQPIARSNEPTIGFISGRGAEALNQQTGNNRPSVLAAQLPKFNPNQESPSIRRTSGVNHNTTAPIPRAVVSKPTNTTPGVNESTTRADTPVSGNANPSTISARPVGPSRPTGVYDAGGLGNPTTNFINPATDASRRVGMPTSMQTGNNVINRGSYKMPRPVPNNDTPNPATATTAPVAGVKRALESAVDDTGAPTTKRAPLADVSNTVQNAKDSSNCDKNNTTRNISDQDMKKANESKEVKLGEG